MVNQQKIEKLQTNLIFAQHLLARAAASILNFKAKIRFIFEALMTTVKNWVVLATKKKLCSWHYLLLKIHLLLLLNIAQSKCIWILKLNRWNHDDIKPAFANWSCMKLGADFQTINSLLALSFLSHSTEVDFASGLRLHWTLVDCSKFITLAYPFAKRQSLRANKVNLKYDQFLYILAMVSLISWIKKCPC